MSSLSLGPLKAAQLYQRITERLVAEVHGGALRPGDRLPSERELARTLGVSRPPVREAIAELQNLGIVVTRPGAGSFIAADAAARLDDGALPTALDVSPLALLEARVTLEPATARLAATRPARDANAEALLARMASLTAVDTDERRAAWFDVDRLFHRQIAVMTGNPVLVAMAEQVAAVMDQPLWRRLEAEPEPDRLGLYAAEHRLIYEAITAGDAEASALLADRHVRRTRASMGLD